MSPSAPARIAPAPRQAAPRQPLRFITAASLFDGHDAAINMIRRLLQSHGAEVIHLGHNRSVAEIVDAAIQEDADAIAVSSYQGGHNEYFTYMVDMLRERGACIPVIVGGGGTIAPEEVSALERYGVAKVYTPEDGRRLGLDGMIEDVLARVRAVPLGSYVPGALTVAEPARIARAISLLERAPPADPAVQGLHALIERAPCTAPVIGITGTGGAGKSSLTDELLGRLAQAFPGRHIAVVAMDPSRRRSGGALLGDRIRMNSLAQGNVFMRSLATRRAHLATAAVLGEVIALYRAAGFDLVIVETAGTGQSDTEIVDVADLTLYVMTAEYGAASQLEKIDMLDYADLIVINKSEKRGAQDALRDVRKQWRRNHPERSVAEDAMPVYATVASRFNDPGVNRLFAALCARLDALGRGDWRAPELPQVSADSSASMIPSARAGYLADIAAHGRSVREAVERRAAAAHRAQGLYAALEALADPALPAPLGRYDAAALADEAAPERRALRLAYEQSLDEAGAEAVALIKAWPQRVQAASSEQYAYPVRGRTVKGENYSETLSHLRVPKLALPRQRDWGELLRFLLTENLPGAFPYTAGVYPYRRAEEDPTRMFAGEGAPERTNRRFHYLARSSRAPRLSTAFDSTTLYGEDPDTRPDVYGRTGNSGVSIATLDDMKKLYSGFDHTAPSTSVSMTINGPAPILLAMFMNTAIDQRIERHLRAHGGWEAAERRIEALRAAERERGIAGPDYSGELPAGHDGSGLALLGVSGDALLERAQYERIRAQALAHVRGTVQADILKEDQAQNTCIFSTEFALRMMGDVQAYFIARNVRNFYSVSVSGYHIAEAGANPVTQLAFTLANGFTLVEYYLSRGMKIDDFAPNLSFFFSNGMDPEYSVMGRVARRIWAVAMRDKYGANERSQKLKYHIQTSGRSLHAQEMDFNDIRTTLQALIAIYDNCNSLHTNAFDEAYTTPTQNSVRRAMAIQMIINREWGVAKNENPNQGSFIIDELTDLVEEAVLKEFERIADRGGVLGAMETGYQRGKIQEESLYYEHKKHDGSLPIIGVNTFVNPHQEAAPSPALQRSTREEKDGQIARLRDFQHRHAEAVPAMRERLCEAVIRNENVFAVLMDAVRVCSLGQISDTLFEVGGQYRRNM